MDFVHFYEITIKWAKGREGDLSEPTLPIIHTATAPPFPGGVPDIWSPEHLFVASINACMMTTFLAIAENSKLAFESYECSARGKLEKVDKIYMISQVVLKPIVRVTFEKDIDRTRRILIKSERHCLISNSVKTKIILEPEIIS
jgi:organic hydroperoxide reductase OsmC/OhrA